MSKYDPLWKYLKDNDKENYKLSFDNISEILGFPVDHSFLNYKKESLEFGYDVIEISLKNRTIEFIKTK